MTELSRDLILYQTGRCDFGDGRGMVAYRLLFDGPSQRSITRRQDEIVALLGQLPEELAEDFARRLEAMTVQGRIATPEFVGEYEAAGPTFDRVFRWAEVAELGDFEATLRAAATPFQAGHSSSPLSPVGPPS